MKRVEGRCSLRSAVGLQYYDRSGAGSRCAIGAAVSTNISAISRGDVRFPTALAAIHDPPQTLWITGDVDALRAPSVAIVGSRAASPYALEVARRLGADLARRNVTVVSGMARGVDSAAHRGALEGGGVTIAVFGCGVDVIYPPEHRGLAERIVERGALVSEFPPGTPPLRSILSAAQPHHQRPVAGRRHRRGGGRQRLADYRRLRARAGAHRARGARQRARRAQLRRARAPARRCKACGVCGRYLGRTSARD